MFCHFQSKVAYWKGTLIGWNRDAMVGALNRRGWVGGGYREGDETSATR